MAFAVISVAPGLSEEEHRRALELGPDFVASAAPYRDLVAAAGWRLVEEIDLTPAFHLTARRMLEAIEARAEELAEVISAQRLEELLTRRRATRTAVDEGLLRRDLFVSKAE